jgi:hypothetical protein
VIDAGANLVGPFIEEFLDPIACIIDQVDVIPPASCQGVGPDAAVEQVVSSLGDKGVVTGKPREAIVDLGPLDKIASVRAVQVEAQGEQILVSPDSAVGELEAVDGTPGMDVIGIEVLDMDLVAFRAGVDLQGAESERKTTGGNPRTELQGIAPLVADGQATVASFVNVGVMSRAPIEDVFSRAGDQKIVSF